jgi:hypothetical protein
MINFLPFASYNTVRARTSYSSDSSSGDSEFEHSFYSFGIDSIIDINHIFAVKLGIEKSFNSKASIEFGGESVNDLNKGVESSTMAYGGLALKF